MAVCSLDRLLGHTIICASVGKHDVMLIWNEGWPVACERACPHEQADLSRGRMLSGRLRCPRHAALFDPGNGTISAGWPSRPLRIYPARIANGQVWINADAVAQAAS